MLQTENKAAHMLTLTEEFVGDRREGRLGMAGNFSHNFQVRDIITKGQLYQPAGFRNIIDGTDQTVCVI